MCSLLGHEYSPPLQVRRLAGTKDLFDERFGVWWTTKEVLQTKFILINTLTNKTLRMTNLETVDIITTSTGTEDLVTVKLTPLRV